MVTSVGLPLLMVNGKFQSLGSMTVKDLETFIPFLVNCSVNRAGARIVNGVPEWWKSVIQYKFPLQKPNSLSQIGYRKHLSSIVCCCYWYHNAQYLLPFCAEVAHRPESVFFKNNEDNTTSIFYVHNTIHIMKFSNENKNYDMKPKVVEKSRTKCLLSALPKKSTKILDIYLCDNCDAEFSSHSEMRKHEKDCYEIILDDDDEDIEGDNDGDDTSDADERNDDSSEEIEILEHIKPIVDSNLGKKNFFNYLQLIPRDIYQGSKRNSVESHFKRWVNAKTCFVNNRKIEFSSYLGRKMLGHLRPDLRKIQRAISVNETHCRSKSNKELRETVDFKVTFKKKKNRNWVHQYCFNKNQRRSRYITLRTGKDAGEMILNEYLILKFFGAMKKKKGLDEESRKLLKQCKSLQIVLNRLELNS